MDCLFLYNPSSGNGKLKNHLPYIYRRLMRKYDRVEMIPTASAEDMERRVREADCDVIFSGGDGTFHRVLQVAGERTLGYLPSGTVNDIARSLNIPRSVRGALNVILRGRSLPFDCMQVKGGEKVMYIAAAGTFTHATYSTPQTQKKALGPLAYALHGLRYDLPLKVFPVRITCDGREIATETVLVLVLNGKTVAGFPVNRRSDMQDGMCELALIRQVPKPNIWQRAGALFSLGSVLLFGIRIKKRDILFLRGNSFKIQTEDSVVWDFDGEKGPHGSIEIQLLPQKVHIFVPNSQNFPNFRSKKEKKQ